MNKLSWEGIPVKKCEECGILMPQRVKIRKDSYRTPTEYKAKRFCDHSCANAFLTRERWKSGWKSPMILKLRKIIPKPETEELNKMFSCLGTQASMAIHYDVSEETIAKWMGRVKYIRHPNLLYREEKLLGTRKLNFDLGNLTSEKRYEKNGTKKKKKIPQDRREYYKNYYLKEKTNPQKMEERRRRAREWNKKHRANKHC